MMTESDEDRWDGLFRALGDLKGEVRRLLDAGANPGPIPLGFSALEADRRIREFWAEHRDGMIGLGEGLLDELIDLVRVRYQVYRSTRDAATGRDAAYPTPCPAAVRLAAVEYRLALDPEADLDGVRDDLLALAYLAALGTRWGRAWDAYLDRANAAAFQEMRADPK